MQKHMQLNLNNTLAKFTMRWRLHQIYKKKKISITSCFKIKTFVFLVKFIIPKEKTKIKDRHCYSLGIKDQEVMQYSYNNSRNLYVMCLHNFFMFKGIFYRRCYKDDTSCLWVGAPQGQDKCYHN